MGKMGVGMALIVEVSYILIDTSCWLKKNLCSQNINYKTVECRIELNGLSEIVR